MKPNITTQEAGFTLIELLMAMAVFSFMLLVIVVGFINVVSLHNQAVAANAAQDSARSAMDTIVQAIRDSSAVVSPTVQGNPPSTTLCLATSGGGNVGFYVDSTTNVLNEFESNSCSAPYTTITPLTSTVEQAYFGAILESIGPASTWKPEVQVTVTVGSNNNSTTGSGANLSCGPTNLDKEFCSVATLTSGAVPR